MSASSGSSARARRYMKAIYAKLKEWGKDGGYCRNRPTNAKPVEPKDHGYKRRREQGSDTHEIAETQALLSRVRVGNGSVSRNKNTDSAGLADSQQVGDSADQCV